MIGWAGRRRRRHRTGLYRMLTVLASHMESLADKLGQKPMTWCGPPPPALAAPSSPKET